MKCLVLAAFGSLYFSISSDASTILHTKDASEYHVEATLYSSVGKVTGNGLTGSGVLISNQWVLTAGHISQGKQAGGVFNIGGANYTIQTSITHPAYLSAGANSFDLGLLYLGAPVTTASVTEMLRYDQPTSIIGKEATYVGIGFTGTGLTGALSSPIEMRAFTNLIEFYGSQYGLTSTSFVSDFDNHDGSINRLNSVAAATRLEGSVAPGDSGGGVFVTENGNPYLIGISSYSGAVNFETQNSKYGGLSGAVDLQQFYPWIFSQTGITAVPEPSVGMWAILSGLVCFRRRR